MKILILTNYLGNHGGLGRYSSQVVKASSDLSLDVKVLTEAKVSTSPIELNVLKSVFNQKKWRLMWNIIFNIISVRWYSRGVDVIHAHDGWPYGFYAWFAVLGTKKKLYITGIGTYTIAPLKETIRGILLRMAYKRTSNIFCISEYVRDRLLKLCPEAKTSVVFMGTTRLPEVSKEKIEESRIKFGLENTNPIFLTVGDIKKRKGQLDTLKSLNLIKSKYPNFKYVMIGDDADTNYINLIKNFAKENNIEKNVLIISKMYDDLVLSSMYSMCDIFMLNSNNDGDHFEGFGLVFLEAAQFGKPVIGSKNCGIENAFKNCYNGFLTEQGNHKDISEKVEEILSDKVGVFGKNSMEFYKGFSWEHTAKAYLDNYKK